MLQEVTVTAVLCGGSVVNSLTFSYQITCRHPQSLVVCPQQFSINVHPLNVIFIDVVCRPSDSSSSNHSVFGFHFHTTMQKKKNVLTANWLPFVGLNISDFVLSFELHVQM